METTKRTLQDLAPMISLALSLIALPAVGQWTTQSPVPTDLEVGGIAAPTADRVFLATADDSFDNGGALFESADGGASWVQRDVPFSLNNGLHGAFFLDDQHGWVWGNENYRTTDGGTTWEELPILGSTYFMEFFSPTFGLARGNGGAYVSRDGGLSWDPSPNGLSAFSFADDLIGLIGLGVADTGVYRTTDGGVSFTLVQAGTASAVSFLSSTVAVAIVDGNFFRSIDSGLSWTAGASAAGRDGLFAVSSNVLLAWGHSGDDRLLRSDDAGVTWADLGEVIAHSPSAQPFAFAVATPSTVVASDGAGNLYRSSDAGMTWAVVYTTPGPGPNFLSTSRPVFADAQTGYFAFGPGIVLKSTDGGASWRPLSSGIGTTLNDVDRFADGRLIAVGENGTVLTTDGGGIWIVQEKISIFHLEAVQVIGPQEVVVVDATGRVFTSSDGGATWTAAASTPSNLEARNLYFTTLLDGWVIGTGFGAGALFHTTDGGTTWTPVPDFLGGYVSVDFEGQSGWAANVGGLFYRTEDGGDTWSSGNLPGSPLQIADMDFFDASVGYAVGRWGDAFRSANGGATWHVLPVPNTDEQFTDIYLLGADELWLSSNSGIAYYSANGGQNWSVMDSESAGFGSFAAIAATPTGDAWMVGSQGYIEFFAGPPPAPLNRPPRADYEFLTTGLSVALTDTSTDPDGTVVSWLWDFGDGNTSTERNPTHEFASANTYHVRLTATDDDGDTGNRLRFIAVQPGPGGTFGDFTEVTPLDPLFVTPQDEDFWVATAAPADYDGDGDLDIAVFGFYVVYNTSVEYRLVLLRNDGPAGPEEWEFAYLDVPVGNLSAGASDLAWGDVDNDGDQDLILGTNGQTVIYRNDAGTLVLSDTVLPPYWEDNDQADFDLDSISWADYDNDGDLDLLLPSVWDEDNFTYRTALMRNDGSNGTGGWFFTEVAAGFAGTGHAQSAWADFDGDSDLDLLLVHLAPLTDDGFIRRYRNDGGGVFVGEDLLGGLTVEHGEVRWEDYDTDGDLDLLVAGHIQEAPGSFNRVLRIYRNDNETYVPVEVIPCPACDGWFDITAATWADFDSDGDVDVMVTGNYNSGSQIEGRARVFANQGGTLTDTGSELPAPRASGSRGGTFSWLDIDGEGDLDYFVAGQYFVPGGNGLVEAQMHLYRNDTAVQNEPPSAPSLLGSQVFGDASVDLWWNPATDDLTPTPTLTYDLRVYRAGVPISTPHRLPERGDIGAASQWSLSALPEGHYRWVLEAVDSAFNTGPAAAAIFTVGNPVDTTIFIDGFESGDLTAWSATSP